MSVPLEPHLFEVPFDGERWLTVTQQEHLLKVLEPWATSAGAAAVGRLLGWAEGVALDVAAIGSVIAHESGRFPNYFHRRDGYDFTVKADAGFPPEGVYHPPAELTSEAAALLRERSRGEFDKNELLEWVRDRLNDWWLLACLFVPGAELAGVDDGGRPEVVNGSADAEPSAMAVGQVFFDVHHDPDAPRCEVEITTPVVDRLVACPFGPDGALPDRCRLHQLIDGGR